MCLAPSADLSLPSGGGFCIDTESGPQYLVHFLLLCWPLYLAILLPIISGLPSVFEFHYVQLTAVFGRPF